MHDGQNLFDAATSFVGEWEVDETLETLSREGIEAIVVGIPNMDERRLDEYSPFGNSSLNQGGQGDAYLAFVCDTLKPMIDADFRTWSDRAHTGIMGSSMGGLISLYAFFHQADTFGLAGVMSPAFWFPDNGAIYSYVEAAPLVSGKLYLDIGTDELAAVPVENRREGITSQVYLRSARRMVEILVGKGYREGQNLRYVEEEGGIHRESAWKRRLPDALRFLLGA